MFLSTDLSGCVDTASTSDRYVTWMAGIAERRGGCLEIVQHGSLLEFKGLPHKIYVSRFGAYNSHEAVAAREKVVRNDDCEFFEFPFVSHVSFSEIKREPGTTYVGIVSQGIHSFDAEAVRAGEVLYPGCKTILMLHPYKEDKAFYGRLQQEHAGLTVSALHKVSNVDVLILSNSTMVYDFCTLAAPPRMLVVSPRKCFSFLDGRVKCFESFGELCSADAALIAGC